MPSIKINNKYSYFDMNNEYPYCTTKPKYINDIQYMNEEKTMKYLISTKENGTDSICRTSNKR